MCIRDSWRTQPLPWRPHGTLGTTQRMPGPPPPGLPSCWGSAFWVPGQATWVPPGRQRHPLGGRRAGVQRPKDRVLSQPLLAAADARILASPRPGGRRVSTFARSCLRCPCTASLLLSGLSTSGLWLSRTHLPVSGSICSWVSRWVFHMCSTVFQLLLDCLARPPVSPHPGLWVSFLVLHPVSLTLGPHSSAPSSAALHSVLC